MIEQLNEQRRLIDGLAGDDDVLETRLHGAASRLQAAGVRVLVAGDLSRGKSTLMNVLAERDVFTASPLQLMTVNVLRHGETPEAVVTRDGAAETIGVEHLPTDESAARVEVSLPLPWLENVEIVEFPALTGTAAGMTLHDAAASADIVIVMVASDALYALSEQKQVEETILANGHEEILFACNFFDRIADDERGEIRQHARKRLPVPESRVYFTSASTDEDPAVQSLADDLRALITNEAARLKEERARRVLKANAEALRQHVTEQAEAYRAAKAAFDGELQQRQTALNDVKSAEARVLSELENFRQQTRTLMESQTAAFIKGLAVEVDQWAADYKGSDLEGHLNKKLRDSLTRWQEGELKQAVEQRVEEQKDLLRGAAAAYAHALETLREQVPGVPDEVDLRVPSDFVPPQSSTVPTVTAAGTPKAGQPLNLMEMPEVLVAGSLTVIALVFRQPLISLLGAGITVYLTYNRLSPGSAQDQPRPNFGAGIRKRSDTVALEIGRAVDDLFGEMQQTVRERLQQTTQAAESAVREEMQAKRAKLPPGLDSDLQQQLDEHINQL